MFHLKSYSDLASRSHYYLHRTLSNLNDGSITSAAQITPNDLSHSMAAPVITPLAAGIIQDFADWFNSSPYTYFASELHGGWERWASADVAMFLMANSHARSIVDLQTESYCYNDGNLSLNARARGDVVVCRNKPAPQWDVVELKCWRVKSAAKQGLKDFLKEFADDATKIQRGLLPGYFTDRTTVEWAIGIAVKKWMENAEVQALVQAQNSQHYTIYDTGAFFLITTRVP